MTACSIDDCELDTYEGDDKCILHCRKADYSVDFHKTGFLRLFYTELINYVVEFVFSYKDETDQINKNALKEHLEHNDSDSEQEITEFAKNSTIVLTEIFFPCRDNRDNFDYIRLLKKLGAIHFSYCEFTSYGLDLTDVETFYQDCVFHQNWHIYNAPILGNVNNVIYQQCSFNESVTVSPDGDERYEITNSLFNNCEFKNKLEFYSVDFNSPVFNNSDNMPTGINEFNISDCTFKDKFILNNCNIGNYISEDNVYNSKFEFKNNKVQQFNVTNTNHVKLVDTYKTIFIKFRIHKSIFEDFVGLENCEFGENGEFSVEYIATFMYATFLSFVNFRNTVFHNGLDIENINLKESPNFLNANINPKYTNRETFRIIKNSFDKIGNHIEANKYYVCEMKKYKEKLLKTNNTQEKIIIYLNEKISDFGQSYIKPVIWIVLSAIVYNLLVLGHENNTLYLIYPPANNIINTISSTLNSIAGSMLPFTKLLRSGMEFVSLLFYVIYASLIWQTIVAVKRHTRR